MKRMVLAAALAAPALLCTVAIALAEAVPDRDLRDIGVGMPVSEIPNTGYVNMVCATDASRKLEGWSAWRDCPADSAGRHAIRFDFDPATSREGTIVAGHPVVLTALIDASGVVAGLRIETDPKARLFLRKKAFLLGLQVKSRYGSDGWDCADTPPASDEQPVGGVFIHETCKKTISGRLVTVQRELFQHPNHNIRDFVDQTDILITRHVE